MNKKSENKKHGLHGNKNALKTGTYTLEQILEDKKSKAFLRKCRAVIMKTRGQ